MPTSGASAENCDVGPAWGRVGCVGVKEAAAAEMLLKVSLL